MKTWLISSQNNNLSHQERKMHDERYGGRYTERTESESSGLSGTTEEMYVLINKPQDPYPTSQSI